MKKRILSLVLVLCMVLSLMPGMSIGAGAATGSESGTHTHNSTTFDTPFTITSGSVAVAKNYYLTGDITATGDITLDTSDSIKLCLNGYTLNMGEYALKLNKANLRVYDHTGEGKITGSAPYGDNTATVMVGGTYFALYGGTIEATTGNAVCATKDGIGSSNKVKIYVDNGDIKGGTAGYGIKMLQSCSYTELELGKNCTSSITGGMAGIYTPKAIIKDYGYAGTSAIKIAMPDSAYKRPVVTKADSTSPDVKAENYQLVSPERTLILEDGSLYDPGPECTCDLTMNGHTPTGFDTKTISIKELGDSVSFPINDTVAVGGECPYGDHTTAKGTWSYENDPGGGYKTATFSKYGDKTTISFPELGKYFIRCKYSVNGKETYGAAVFTVVAACNCELTAPQVGYSTPIEIPHDFDSVDLDLTTVFKPGVLTNNDCLVNGHRESTVANVYSIVNNSGIPSTVDGVSISGSTLTATSTAVGKGGYIQLTASANGITESVKTIFNVTKEVAHTHDGITFSQWKQGDSLPTSGTYYLTKDVTLANQVTIPSGSDLKLCLNGYKITLTGSERAFNVEGTLSIYDDTGKTGKVIGNSTIENGLNLNGAGIYVTSTGVFNLYGGTITGCKTTASGGGVYVTEGGTFNMLGGTISGNNAANGGGVYNAGTLTLGNKAAIKNNTKGSGTTTASNLETVGTATITYALQLDGSIGLSGTENTNLITAGPSITLSEQRSKFFSDIDGKEIATVDAALQIVTCTCTVSAPTIAEEYASGVAIKLHYSADIATFDLSKLIGTQGTIGGSCPVDGHSVAVVTNTYAVTGDGASIADGVLTVTKVGSATVTVKSTVNGKESTGVDVTFTVTKGEAPPEHADHAPTVQGGMKVIFDTQWNSITTGAQKITTNTNIVLMEDVTLESFKISGSSSSNRTAVYLCLNGHKLTVTNGITIANYANLSICDCSSDPLTGSIAGGVKIAGYGESYNSVSVYGGTIDSVETTPNGYFDMKGGKITNRIFTTYASTSQEGSEINIFGNAIVEGTIYAQCGNVVNVYGNAKVNEIETYYAANVYPSQIHVYGTPTVRSIKLANAGTEYVEAEQADYPNTPYTGEATITISSKNGWETGRVVDYVTDTNYMKFVPDSASGKAFYRAAYKQHTALYAGAGCAVSYDSNGAGAGGAAPTGGSYAQGQQITLPGVGDMRKENCVFKGWSTDEFGAAIADEDAEAEGVQWTVPERSGVTLHAIWSSTVVSGGDITTLDETTLDGILGEYNYTLDSSTTPETITLESDIQLSTTLVFAGVECVFDLNGHAITQAPNATSGGICLGGDKTATPTKVTIIDTPGGGSVTGMCSNGNAAVNVLAKTDGDSFVIEGGTFTGVGCAGIAAGSPDATVSLTINGGKFVGDTNEDGADFYFGGINGVISGGEFSSAYLKTSYDDDKWQLSGGSFDKVGGTYGPKISTLLAPGYSFWKDGSVVSDLTGTSLEGNITVAPSPQASYTTDGTNTLMGSFKDAVANAQDGSTITVINDVELSETIKVSKNLTVVAEGNRTIKQTASISSYSLITTGYYNTLTLGTEAGMGNGNTLTIDGNSFDVGTFEALVEGKIKMYSGVTVQNSGYYGLSLNAGSEIHGGTIQNCDDRCIDTDENVSIENATIIAKSYEDGLGVGGGTCTVKNTDISGGNYGVYVSSGNVILNEGTKIHNNSRGIFWNGAGTVTLNSGVEIYGNTGPAFYFNDSGKLNINEGAKIYNNSTVIDFNDVGCTITMNGGEIYGNFGKVIDGTNYPYSGTGVNTIKLLGGKIYGNKGDYWTGAIVVNQYNQLVLGGTEIYNNFTDGAKNDATGLYEGTTQRNIYLTSSSSGSSANALSFVKLQSGLTGANSIGFSGDSTNIAVGTPIVQSDGTYTITADDMAKFTWEMTGTNNRKLVLDGEGTAAVIKLANALSAPTFSIQPTASTTVTFGSISGSLTVAANLAADASSETMLSYQWQQKGTEDAWSNIEGETGASFTIPTDLAAETYTYRCVATATLGNDTQSTNSDGAAVTVSPKAITGTAAISGTATYGETLTAGYTDGDANETVSYAWYRSGTEESIGSGDSYTLAAEDVGKTITLKVIGTGNYGGEKESAATGAVARAQLAVTGTTIAGTKEYDGSTTSAVSAQGTLSGVVGSDGITVLATAKYDDKNVGTEKQVTITYAINGGSNQDCYLAPSSTTATAAITVKDLTVTGMTATDREYNGTTAVTITGGTLSGLVQDDNVTLVSTGVTGTITDGTAGVGNGKAVTVSGYTIDGADKDNYSFTQPTGVTVNITPLNPATVGARATSLDGHEISDKPFTITPAYAYTGSEIKPKIKVELYVNGAWVTLAEGTDYELDDYRNNVEIGTAGAAQFSISFKGNYNPKSGIIVKFSVTAATLPAGTTNETIFTDYPDTSESWSKDPDGVTFDTNEGWYVSKTAPVGTDTSVTFETEGENRTETVYVKDSEGNTYTTEVIYSYDKTAPELDVADAAIGNPTEWKNAEQTITLAPTDGVSGVESVTVTKKDDTTTVTVTETDGEYSFTTIGNGEYNVTVTDTAGNKTEKTISVSKIDTTKPTASIDEIANVPESGWFTKDVTVNVSVSDTNIKEWKYSLDNGKTWTKGTGTSFTISDNGDYTGKVKIKAVDQAGNETISAAADVKLDKATPAAPNVSVKDGKNVYTISNYPSSWTANDVEFGSLLVNSEPVSGIDKFQYSTNGGQNWNDIEGKSYTHKTNTDTSGVSYIFRAVSKAGTVGLSTGSVTVKRSALDDTELNATKYTEDMLKIGNSGIADTWYTTTPTITVTKPQKVGTNDNALDATTYYKLWETDTTEPTNGTTLSDTSITIPNDGEWTLQIWTEDAAGNKTPTLTKTIAVDTTKPELDTTDAAIGNPTEWKNAEQTITLIPEDVTAGIKSVTVVKKGEADTVVTVAAGTGENEGKYTFITIGNGEYTVTITDNAGNSEDFTITVSKVDTTKPAITIPEFDSTKWYGATEITVGVEDGDSKVKTVTVIGGHFTEAEDIKTAEKFTATETVAKSYAYTITATDNVGNESTKTVTISIDLRIDIFIEKVEALGSNPTYSDLAKVVGWFESQSELVKNHIKANDNANAKLEKLQKDFKAAAETAKDDIVSDIGDADTIEEIKDAKRDYDALPEEVKKDIPADIVKELTEKADNAKAAEDAKNLIDEAAKPDASYDDKSAAVDAWEKLSDDQKALIRESESSYNTIKADVDAVDKVIDLIDGMKKPYTKDAITEAQDAYNNLDTDQKNIFPADKKGELDGLTAMLGKAEAVEALIKKLPDSYTGASDDTAIKTAKAAYDSLTADEKALLDPVLKTKLDTLYKDMLSSKDAEEKAKIEAEKKFTDKVSEVLNDPTLDKINDLLKDKEALEKDGNYNDLPQNVKDGVENLEKAKDIIEALDKITKDNIVDETNGGKLSEDAEKALDEYNKLPGDNTIKDIVDKATDNKADDIGKVGEALDKIDKIPTHNDEVKNDKGEITTPATGVGEDCEKQTDNEHSSDEHQKAIEDAKDALEKLPDGAKDLIPEDKKEQVKDEYEKLVKYLDYITIAKTGKTEVEVVGMTDKVTLPADSAAAEKTVLEVVATDSHPGNMPKVPTGKSEVLSVDVKLVAKIYTNKDDENPSATQIVQPAPGENVTVKLLIPNGYKLDTLEVWHVKDNGSRSRITSFTLTTESGKTYAVFEIDSFSHFVFFAEQENTYVPTTPEKPTVTAPENGSVDVSPANPAPGQNVTITTKPDKGYEVGDVTVEDKNGNKIPVTDKGDGSFTFTQPDGKVTITVTFKPEGAVFGDVSKDDWFYEAVKYVYENGLMNGTGDGDFSPYLDTTRGMIVTVLWRLEDEPNVGTNVFEDVAEGAYYAKAVAWAAENKIVEGYGDGKFGPRNSITREQMATILYRYAGYKGLDISKTAELTDFKDAIEVSAYAKEAVGWAVASGLSNGKDNGKLDPKGSAVRCEAAAMLMRFCKIGKA